MSDPKSKYDPWCLSEWFHSKNLVNYQMMDTREGTYVVLTEAVAKGLIRYLTRKNSIYNYDDASIIRCLNCGNSFIKDGKLCVCYDVMNEYNNYRCLISNKPLMDIDLVFKQIKQDIRQIRRKNIEKKAEGQHSYSDLELIYKLQAELCYYCMSPISSSGQNKYSIDHIVPLSEGGSNWPINIALTCKNCNLKKSWKSEGQFLRKLRKGKSKDWVDVHKEYLSLIRRHKRKIFVLSAIISEESHG